MAWKAVSMLVLLALGCTNGSQTVKVAPPVGERGADRASIIAALDEVQEGGTLQFAPGAYVIGEGIRVAVPRITLQGHAEGTVLRGCDAVDFPDAREVGVENAVVPCNGLALVAGHQTVRGLTFEYAWHALWVGCCLPPELAGPEVVTETESPHVGGHLVEDNTFRNVVNAFRVIGDSPEPVVIRNNTFINVWHAGGVNGRTAHIVDNRVSVPDPGQVPLNGFPGLALFITPHDTRGDQAFTCAGNVIAGNRIEGHPEGITVLILGAGGSCHDNVIRANTIAVSRVRFSRAPWGVIGIRSDADSTLVGVPIALVDLVAEMAEFFQLRGKTGDEELIYDNVVEENAILGAEGLGIEILRASRNRIVSNSITGIAARHPFPGNTMYVAPEWREANGSGIWISRGSNDNEIVGNTFATVNGHAIVVEGDRNVVEARSVTDEVRNLGSANQVRRLAGGTH